MLDKLLNAIRSQSDFNSSVFTLLSGTTVALLIAYIAQPILTRLYPPEAFGIFEAFGALVGLLIPFASLRYEDAIMLPEKDDEALHLLGLSIVLVILAVLASLIFHYLGPLIDTELGMSSVAPWLIWIPPVLLSFRFTKLGELWLSRQKKYPTISSTQILQSGVTAGSRVLLGRLIQPAGPLGLIAGYCAGYATAMTAYIYLILRREKQFFKRAFQIEGLAQSLRRYRHFPYFSMPSTLLSALISRLPFLLLLYFFDEATIGFLGRSFALFATPLSLLGNAVSQVFFVDGVEAHRKGSLPELIRRVHARLIWIGLFPATALMITGPHVFGSILGQPWIVSGHYLQWIAPWLFLAGVASPLTRLFDILEKQRLDLFASCTMFFFQTIALILGGLTGDIYTCLLYMCIGGSAGRLTQLMILFIVGGAPVKGILRDYLNYFLLSTPLLILLYSVLQFDRPWLTTFTFGVSALIYLFVSARFLQEKNA